MTMLRQRRAAFARQCLWAGILVAGNCLAGEPDPLAPPRDDDWRPAAISEEMRSEPKLVEPGTTTIVEPGCPPENFWSRLTQRVVPGSDLIGMPLHHRNFFADCYGENWRLKQFDLSTKHGRHRQRWHDHSVAMEHHWGWVFGKPPRGYIHDTSGHPLRSYFVPQPPDPTIPFEPGSDTLMPARLVIDYPLYVYGKHRCPVCDAEEWGDQHENVKVMSPR